MDKTCKEPNCNKKVHEYIFKRKNPICMKCSVFCLAHTIDKIKKRKNNIFQECLL